MSDVGTSTSGNSGEVILYSCRHCPGLVLTEAEKDVHRQQHRRRRNISGLRHSREDSPATSLSAASFIVVQQAGKREGQGPTTKGKKHKKDDPEVLAETPKKAGRNKRRTIKKYDKNVKITRNNSG